MKSFGNLPLPPKTATYPSKGPPDESKYQLELLGKLSKDLEALRKELANERGKDLLWRSEIEEKIERHAAIISELRENVSVGREIHSEIRELTVLQHELAASMRRVMRSDTQQNIELAKAEAAQAGAKQGQKSGRIWGGGAAAIAMIVAEIIRRLWLP